MYVTLAPYCSSTVTASGSVTSSRGRSDTVSLSWMARIVSGCDICSVCWMKAVEPSSSCTAWSAGESYTSENRKQTTLTTLRQVTWRVDTFKQVKILLSCETSVLLKSLNCSLVRFSLFVQEHFNSASQKILTQHLRHGKF